MFYPPFKTNSFRNMIIAFGTLFDNISIQRYNTEGTVEKTIKVPLLYASKSFWFNRLQFNNNDENTYDGSQSISPRMSYNMTSFMRDSNRQLSPTAIMVATDAKTALTNSMMMRVPYIFNFELKITAEYLEDYYQIVEQILPYFTPGFSMTLHDNEIGIKTDIHVVLDAEELQSPTESDMNNTRQIVGTLNFEIQGYIYHNNGEGKSNTPKLIYKAYINMYPEDSAGTTITSTLEITNPPNYNPNDPSTWSKNITLTFNPDIAVQNGYVANQSFGPYTQALAQVGNLGLGTISNQNFGPASS